MNSFDGGQSLGLHFENVSLVNADFLQLVDFKQFYVKSTTCQGRKLILLRAVERLELLPFCFLGEVFGQQLASHDLKRLMPFK